MTKQKPENVPRELDAIADMVLAYKPKAKSANAKKRKKRAVKIARGKEAKPSFSDAPSKQR